MVLRNVRKERRIRRGKNPCAAQEPGLCALPATGEGRRARCSVCVRAVRSGRDLHEGVRRRGLDKSGIKLIGTGDVTDDDLLADIGDSALDAVTTHHYSAAHDSPENKAFV